MNNNIIKPGPYHSQTKAEMLNIKNINKEIEEMNITLESLENILTSLNN